MSSPAHRRALLLSVATLLVASGLVSVVLGDQAYLEHLRSR
jgi:hypothetical protein